MSGRWVWQPDDPDDWRARLVDILPDIGRIREMNNPALPPERRAALWDELLAEKSREIGEWAAGSAQRRAARRESGIGTYGRLD